MTKGKWEGLFLREAFDQRWEVLAKTVVDLAQESTWLSGKDCTSYSKQA